MDLPYDIIYSGQWHALESSCVAAVRYDPEWWVLWLRFRTGTKEYPYPSVKPRQALAFLMASSHGQYVAQHLRKKKAG